MAALHAFLTRRKKAIMTSVALALLFALAGIFTIRVQVDRVRYLKESSDICRAVNFIDDKLAGTTQLDVWVEGGSEGAVKEPCLLNKIEGLVAFLRDQPEITKVISVNDFLKEMNRAFYAGDDKQYVLPATRENIAQFLLLYSMSGRRNEVDKYVDYPYSRTRISVRTAQHNSARLDALMARMNAYLAAHFKVPYSARLASVAVPNNNVFHYLLRGLLVGLGAAVLVVGLIMCVTFRSVFVGLVSMIPNMLPIVMCLGLMGWTNVWLEIATAMTFSIALGIAVDDTIHFLSRFRLELTRCGDHEQALRATLENIGWALIKTTVVIMGGFLVLLFASLKMNITFGLLAAFIMFITLVADLFITPVCLLVFRPFDAQPASPRLREQEPAMATSSE
jgi:predicted RND superfamily exporter protein